MSRQSETSFSTEKHLGPALGIPSMLLCRKRGIFEAQPFPTPLFYKCISNIQGPEHQICSCSHFVQHAALTICTHSRKTTWVFSTFYCVVQNMGTVLTHARCVNSGEAVSCQAGSRHGKDNMCAVGTQTNWGLRLCHLKLLVSNIRPGYSHSKLWREEHSSPCTPNPTSASAAANPFPLCFYPILVY